ncbi:hypothetical protein [Pseudomonas sp. KCJK9000]|uniref:hypothetical protein n=1 Tax=Pseudomonas sp. KCJK9000 TaxID=3344566 RepID=UPI0039068790
MPAPGVLAVLVSSRVNPLPRARYRFAGCALPVGGFNREEAFIARYTDSWNALPGLLDD